MATAANDLKVSDIIGKLTLVNFKNALVLGNEIDMSYSEKFGKGDDQIGNSIRIRKPINVIATENNMAWNASNAVVSEGQVSLVIDRTLTVPMAFSDADLTLKVERFVDRFLSKATAVIASKIDASIASAVSNCTVGTASFASNGTTSTATAGGVGGQYVVGSFASTLTPDTIAFAKQVLADKGCPVDEGKLVGVLSTIANRRLVIAQASLFNTLGKIGDEYRKGYIGEYDGISFKTSQSLVSHVNGAVGVFTTSTSASTEQNVAWAETATLTVPATSGAIKAGDTFEYAGVYVINPFTKVVTSTPFQVVVTSDAVSGATSLTVSPAPILVGAYQNISSTLSGKTASLKDATGSQGVESIIFHKEAIVGASPELSAPKKSSLDMVESIADEELPNFKIRFLRGYDMNGVSGVGGAGQPGFTSRFDIAYGIKLAQPEFIVRVRTA